MSKDISHMDMATAARDIGHETAGPQTFLIFLGGKVGGDKIQSTVKDPGKTTQPQEYKDMLWIYSYQNYHLNEMNKATQLGTPSPVGMAISIPLYSSCVPGFHKSLYEAEIIDNLTFSITRHEGKALVEVASLAIDKCKVGAILNDTGSSMGPAAIITLLPARQTIKGGGKQHVQETQTKT